MRARAGPTWRSYRFVLALTTLWAAAIIVLNAVLGSNYGYLNAKPVTHSLLDILGPWPWYVMVEAVLIAVGLASIIWPWNREATGRDTTTTHTEPARLRHLRPRQRQTTQPLLPSASVRRSVPWARLSG